MGDCQRTYEFDKVIDRHHTDSVKWTRFGEDVLPLWVADMDFASPPEAIQAIQQRITHPVFGYAALDDELLDSIVRWLDRHYHWQVEPEAILLVPGVVTGLNWAAHALVNQGETYAIQTPVYQPFFDIGTHAHLKRKEIPLIQNGSRYEIDFEALEKQICPDVKLFILCNPHNPVGRVFTYDELSTLGQICKAHNVFICSDEIHCDLVYPGHQHIPIASINAAIAEQTVTLMAPSKTFNIPGLHFSFAIVPDPKLRSKMEAGRSGLVCKPGILACAAAKACYQQGDEWLAGLMAYLEGNRDLVHAFVKDELPGISMALPEATYLAWLDCRRLELDKNPCDFFHENARVAMNAGDWFGVNGQGFVRLNFGCPRPTLSEALERISSALKK